MTKKPWIAIILSFSVGIGIGLVLIKTGALDALDNLEGEIAYAFISWRVYALTFGLPIITFIIYGIYDAIHSEDTVEKQKEPLPWEYEKKKQDDNCKKHKGV